MFRCTETIVKPNGEKIQHTIETDQLRNLYVINIIESILGVQPVDDVEADVDDDDYPPTDEDAEEDFCKALVDNALMTDTELANELIELKRRVDYLESLAAGKHLKVKE